MSEQRTIVFDPEELTLGEMEEIEGLVGVSFQELVTMFEAEKLTTIAMRAIMYILIKKDEPEFTFDDAKSLTVADLNNMEVPDDDAPLVEAVSGEAG